MKWDETIKLTDVAIVVAGLAKILAGPPDVSMLNYHFFALMAFACSTANSGSSADFSGRSA